jgi:membrane-associated phospholipid phosphatase
MARRRTFRPLLLAGGWIVATEAAIWLAKVVIGRTPPGSGIDQVYAGGMSYPSGHATGAFALLLIAVTLATTPGSVIDKISCWSVPVVAATVAIAAVQLHYHWPSDALAGWALGLSAGILARQSIRSHRRSPAAGSDRAENSQAR